jgi:hypothetical protein
VIYRKWGRVVRCENGVVIRVEEAGEAWEENGVFFARPIAHDVILSRPFDSLRSLRAGSDGEGSRARVMSIADEILRCAQDDVKAERVIVTEGVAVHECDGVRWEEETRRVHVALVRKPWRILVDDGEAVARAAEALARCEGERGFERVRLAPHVAAALILTLPCEREQLSGGRDGCGRPIEHRRVEGDPPNVYRPSYRVRPVPMWLNVRALPFGVVDPGAPEAVALLDAPAPAALVVDGGRAFITPLRLDRVIAVSRVGEVLL